MILNETLQKHKDCIEQCEIKRDACELDQKNGEKCDSEKKMCERDCDFDYGP